MIITDANGCIDSAFANVACPTDILEISVHDDFIVYPNPTSGEFTIESTANNYEIIILNILGEEIMTQNSQIEKSKFDLSTQSNGIYFLQIKSKKGTATQKLIIQK